jgi:sterol desaturase/sphingolipid hydroxylase (fatty acid hydroxylase superfamily)
MKMLNNEKIILMTKLSLYEQKNEKSEIKSSRYFKSDYMLMKMLGSFISVTVGYILCLVLWIIFSADKMIGSMTTTGKFVGLLVILAIIYVALTVTYMIFSYAFYSHRFRKIRRNLKEYNGDLKTLHRIQEQEYDAIIDELEEGGEEA